MRISDWSSDVCSSDLGQQSRRSGGHDGLPAFDPGAGAADSMLGRLYQIGRRELTERLAEGRASGSRFAILAHSIAAIRSALDAGQVLAHQKPNKQMVLLTIPILAGPFPGFKLVRTAWWARDGQLM